jgi:hypothetical protein
LGGVPSTNWGKRATRKPIQSMFNHDNETSRSLTTPSPFRIVAHRSSSLDEERKLPQPKYGVGGRGGIRTPSPKCSKLRIVSGRISGEIGT